MSPCLISLSEVLANDGIWTCKARLNGKGDCGFFDMASGKKTRPSYNPNKRHFEVQLQNSMKMMWNVHLEDSAVSSGFEEHVYSKIEKIGDFLDRGVQDDAFLRGAHRGLP